VEKIIQSFSDHVYETYFKDIINRSKWKIGCMSKELDGIKEELWMIGYHFEKKYWKNHEKDKNHFYITITKKRNEIGGDTFLFRFEMQEQIETGKKEKIRNDFLAMLRENAMDCIVDVHRRYNTLNMYTTGEKSEKIKNIYKIIAHDKALEQDYYAEEWSLGFVLPKYQILINVEEECIKIYLKDIELATIESEEEAKAWIQKELSDKEAIHEIQENVQKKVMEKTKMECTSIRFNEGIYFWNEGDLGKTVLSFTIMKTIHMGIIKYALHFNGGRYTLSSIEAAEKKAMELGEKYAHSIRIRKTVGNE